MNNLFKQTLAKLNIELSELQYKHFELYYEMLAEWNKVMNLTAITEYDEVVIKHFADSLSIVKVYDMKQNLRVLDMGTGAGFPGIPLKIVFPQLEIVLLDSLNKRIKFLNEVIQRLELSGIAAIHGRAEDYARQREYREAFDLCVSRAVANLATLSEFCIPYIRVGGMFIAYKSGEVDKEVDNSRKIVDILGGSVEKVIKYNLLDTEIERSFVKIGKVDKTASKYPRKAGLPAKKPILTEKLPKEL